MIYTPQSYDFIKLKNMDVITDMRGNRAGREKTRYKNIVCAFDIETSRVITGYKKNRWIVMPIYNSFMYIWAFQIGREDTVLGRTWAEYKEFIEKIENTIGTAKLVVYVHNLAFEFQFLSGIYPSDRWEVFAPKSRRPLKATYNDKIEYRCSYYHSNMSLEKFLESVGVEDKKKVGDLDYNIVRFPWTEMKRRELGYCINDVKGLVEAIYIEMERDGDTLMSIPLTSTAYLRREVKALLMPIRDRYKNTIPPYKVYQILRKAFRGGDTHANRWYADRIINDIYSDDRVSSYPAVLMNECYPMGAWRKVETNCIDTLFEQKTKGYAFVCTIRLWNVRLIDEYYPDPYIPIAKCEAIGDHINDNGRVLSADYLEISVTDIDLEIILSIYDFDNHEVTEAYKSKYDYLPQPLRDKLKELFEFKTQFKGIPEQEYYYMKSKNKFNAAYGMMAQNPMRESNIYVDGVWQVQKPTEENYIHDRKNAFLSYAWGVWCTAWARKRLIDGINIAYETGEKVVYWDTDSVKHTGDIRSAFADYNAARREESTKNGGVATDKKGITHYLGVYEYDGYYTEFKTMGAKKYAYRTEDGELHTTIAGVVKKLGGAELDKHGGLRAMKEGFTFYAAGGKDVVYQDEDFGTWKTPEGKEIYISKNCSIVDSTYRLSVTDEYRSILDGTMKRRGVLA